MEVLIEFTGPHPAEVALKYDRIAGRILQLEPAFDEAMGVLENREMEIFAAWNGKYVDTGALLDSLTQPDADGAIREAHADYALFGSAIPYSVYQREHGRSAVMRFDEADAAEVGAVVMKYIMLGFGEADEDTE